MRAEIVHGSSPEGINSARARSCRACTGDRRSSSQFGRCPPELRLCTFRTGNGRRPFLARPPWPPAEAPWPRERMVWVRPGRFHGNIRMRPRRFHGSVGVRSRRFDRNIGMRPGRFDRGRSSEHLRWRIGGRRRHGQRCLAVRTVHRHADLLGPGWRMLPQCEQANCNASTMTSVAIGAGVAAGSWTLTGAEPASAALPSPAVAAPARGPWPGAGAEAGQVWPAVAARRPPVSAAAPAPCAWG